MVMRPIKVTDRQRVEPVAGVAACRVSIAPLGRPAAKPSRLNAMAEMVLFAVKVSVPENALCARKGVAKLGDRTIQPLFHTLLPAAQVAPLVDTQMLTVWPSLIASERANCRSPSSPLISAEMRFELVTYW